MRRAFQEILRRRLRVQQCSNLSLQRLVARTGVPEKRVALLDGTLQYGLEQAIEPFPLILVHRPLARSVRDTARFWRCSSRVAP